MKELARRILEEESRTARRCADALMPAYYRLRHRWWRHVHRELRRRIAEPKRRAA